MKVSNEKQLNELLNNKPIFFNYMRENYKLFNNSNIFFRDIQFAIRRYFSIKNQKLSYTGAETITKNFVVHLVNEKWLLQVGNNTWKVNFNNDYTVN
ncbi:MAG: hypothetical protein K9I69_09000 [Ignavibacteriales bacterium]|nr:hypothetical protein [Ignavibacteriales bacterium]MCF8306453.1 hypothetical protein [Ignavibacteriales bacterium]MCF8435691.1 hypothetical protein [Ignavibacteriales bacterium]